MIYFKFKACTRCHWDLAPTDDPTEFYCIQCGDHIYKTPPLPFVRERAGQGHRKSRARSKTLPNDG